jgi:hypothetical protein
MRVLIEAIGLVGPGLAGWDQSRAALAGAAQYVPAAVQLPPVEALPPAERRRTGPPVRLALSVGLQALGRSGRDAANVVTVFTSSGGDGQVIHEICESLTTAERDVSPTRFHNSVHNAPAGYWGIATRSHAASTSLCAFDWSFAAGLLEACVQATTSAQPVLLVSYDAPYPEPLRRARPVQGTLGMAFLFSAAGHGQRALAELELKLTSDAPESTRMHNNELEALRQNNPTGRGLPLLAAIAGGDTRQIVLDHLGATLSLRMTAG